MKYQCCNHYTIVSAFVCHAFHKGEAYFKYVLTCTCVLVRRVALHNVYVIN